MGILSRSFIERGLLLNITDIWQDPNGALSQSYTDTVRRLSSDTENRWQYFLPTDYYQWAIYYRKSIFNNLNLKVPETWEEFTQVCETIRTSLPNVYPITIGGKYHWPVAGWFDYMNMRVNGPEFHRDLCDGKVCINHVRNFFLLSSANYHENTIYFFILIYQKL